MSDYVIEIERISKYHRTHRRLSSVKWDRLSGRQHSCRCCRPFPETRLIFSPTCIHSPALPRCTLQSQSRSPPPLGHSAPPCTLTLLIRMNDNRTRYLSWAQTSFRGSSITMQGRRPKMLFLVCMKLERWSESRNSEHGHVPREKFSQRWKAAAAICRLEQSRFGRDFPALQS